MSNIELNKDIGIRLKSVRLICNEGTYFTVKQFAHLLNITTERLLNYESGRSELPINVLIELYNRGINPIFLLTGEGEVFTKNDIGKSLKDKILNKNIDYKLAIENTLSNFYKKDRKIKNLNKFNIF